MGLGLNCYAKVSDGALQIKSLESHHLLKVDIDGHIQES